MAIEEEFSIEIPDKEADSILSIDKAVNYILGQPDGTFLQTCLAYMVANVLFNSSLNGKARLVGVKGNEV